MTDVALIGCILFTDFALIGGMLYVGITIVVFVRMAVAMGMDMISGGRCMDERRRSRPLEPRFAGSCTWNTRSVDHHYRTCDGTYPEEISRTRERSGLYR